MKLLYKTLAIFVVGLLLTAPAAAQLGKDNGRGSDGVLIFPKKFALFCDISSTDIGVDGTVKKCLNKMLRLRDGARSKQMPYEPLFNEAFHQVNAEYLYKSLQQRSVSADVKDEISLVLDECKDKSGGAAGDVASSVSASEEGGSKLRRRQCENVNLSALTAERVVGILDNYSSLLALKALDYYRQNEFNTGSSAEVEEEEME